MFQYPSEALNRACADAVSNPMRLRCPTRRNTEMQFNSVVLLVSGESVGAVSGRWSMGCRGSEEVGDDATVVYLPAEVRLRCL